MTYVYEFRRFLDTLAIREHNKNTCFVPSEQAILICASQKASIFHKIKALKYLLETYTEDEFDVGQVAGCDTLKRCGVTFREVIQYKISVWEKVLESRYDNNEVIYVAFFDERGFVRDTISSAHFFSDYYGAYSYLQKEKLSYSEGCKDTPVYGRILRIPVDSAEDWCDFDELVFDSDMNLTMIREKQQYYADKERCMPDLSDAFSCYISIPWKVGDLLKESSPYRGESFGILRSNYPEREEFFQFPDWTVSLDVYDERTGQWTYKNGVSVLSLESCTEKEALDHQLMIDGWKRMKSNQRSARAEDFPSVENTEQIIREWLKDYREYLDTLNVSERNRKIITAFLDGERYSELARKFSLSPSRVRSLVVRFKMKVYWQEREKKRSGGEL